MKPLVIYHDNCADGFGAAFAAWLKLGDEAEYVAYQYGEKLMSVDMADIVGREVYILDFSFPREVMDGIFANAQRVVWLDHHKTAFEMWIDEGLESSTLKPDYVEVNSGKKITAKEVLEAQRDDGNIVRLHQKKSGAVLAWEYFHPHLDVPMLIKHIDDYDRWQFALKGTKEINKALWSFAPWSFPQWQEIIDDDQYGSMWSQGSAILRAHDQNVQSVLKGAARECCIEFDDAEPGDISCNTATFSGLAANCPPHLTSDVGHELATQSSTFGLCWALQKDGTLANCSLRSNGDYDVSAIAKSFGGGGHRNAAGFQVDIRVLLGWLK